MLNTYIIQFSVVYIGVWKCLYKALDTAESYNMYNMDS